MDNKDERLQNILKQLEKFGFEFYGYDENGMPLVMSSNKQVVEINIAINFVNQQINEQKEAQSSGGSLEAPNLAENLDTSMNVETSIERSVEVESTQEKKEEKEEQKQIPNPAEDTSPKKAPQIQLNKPKIKPYEAGFDPKSFDPGDVNSTLNFIEKNSKANNTSSNKWVAEQFKKFLKEFNG